MSSNDPNVLLVGQLYQDFILHVDQFPSEDSKKRASKLEIRSGGNCGNTLKVLSQLPKVQTWCMSSLGPKEEAGSLLLGLENQGVNTSTCVFHDHGVNPSSYVIHASDTGTRTIISYNEAQDITLTDFQEKVEKAMSDTNQCFTWVHFEGRNIDNAVQQINWLHTKATKENWRDRLTISAELEKPDRENIDALLDKGDILFFSKLFAEKRGFSDAPAFLKDYSARCRPSSILFCTWGAQGATCLVSATNQIISTSALAIDQVVDTVGAGDTFTAGVIYGLSHGFDLLDVLKFSCELAGRKVAQTGFDGLKQQMDSTWNNVLCD